MKNKILIIDDSTIQKMMLTDIISDEYEVFTASTYGEAMLLVSDRQLTINLFILSLVSPQLHGFELIQAIKKEPGYETTPILVVTSSEDPKEIQIAFDAGANDILTKPFVPEVAGQRIKSAFESHKRYLEILNNNSDLTAENFDKQTGTLVFNTTKWLINEKLNLPVETKIKVFTLYQINNLDTIDRYYDYYVYRSILNTTAKIILNHYQYWDVVGRVRDNAFGVFGSFNDLEEAKKIADNIIRLVSQNYASYYSNITITCSLVEATNEDIFTNLLQRATQELEDNASDQTQTNS